MNGLWDDEDYMMNGLWDDENFMINGLRDDENFMMNGLWDDDDNVTQNPSLHHPLKTCYDSLVNEQCSCS